MVKRTQHDSPDKTCTKDECERPLRARGLCAYHYRLEHPSHVKAQTAKCDGCGIEYSVQRANRGMTHHCSELCRQWSQFGAWSSTLPKYHITKWYGQTCTVNFPTAYKCEWCGAPGLTKRTAQRFCSRECKRMQSKATRRGREHNSIGTYSWAQVARLWRSFDGCCAYCRTPTPLPEIQAEHVVALSCGGANNLSNLLPSCGPCNADKRDLSLVEWSADRARRKLPAVTTSWGDDDPHYMHLATGRTLVRMAA